MRLARVFGALAFTFLILARWGVLPAQTHGKKAAARGARLGEERTETHRIGVIVTADGGPCTGVLATLPVPMDWPEQSVTVVKEEKSSHVKKLEYKVIGGVRQMRVTIPSLPAGAEAKALLTLKIQRRALSPPEDADALELPEKLSAELKGYLLPSPYIESTDPKIIALAKELTSGKETAWQRAEAICAWVRANIKYENRDTQQVNASRRGARKTLAEGAGDCEEMTSLFVALCRANKIPARTVIVLGHCYPEFYLVDKSGQGGWLACEAAGDGAFGEVAEFRPILQKGDNFRLPEKREPQHYVTQFLSTKNGQPSVKFVREKVTSDE